MSIVTRLTRLSSKHINPCKGVVAYYDTCGGFTNPTDIADVVLWLDGSDATTILQVAGTQPWGAGNTPVTADTQTVGSWLDKSGQDNHVNQGTANREPTYRTNKQNGLSIVRGINVPAQEDYLYSTQSVLSQDANVTIFYVALIDNNEDFGTIYSNTDTDSNRMSAYIDSRDATRRGITIQDSTGFAAADMPADIGGEYNQITLIIDNPTIQTRLNGAAGSASTVAGDGVTANDYTRVFNQVGNTNWLFGSIGELVIYNRTLSAGEIGRVEAWLKAKWATP